MGISLQHRMELVSWQLVVILTQELFNLTVNEENQEFYIYRLVDDELEYSSGSPDRYFVKNADILLHNSQSTFNSFTIKQIPSAGFDSQTLSYTNTDPMILSSNTNYKIDIYILFADFLSRVGNSVS